MTSALFGEKYLSKVGAQFGSVEEVREATKYLTSQTGIDTAQIRVIEPNDPAIDRKLEPETRGIARTLAKSHLTLGVAGLVAGLVLAFVLVATGVAAFSWNPVYTYLVFGFFGGIVGLLFAGMVSLRPDQDRLIAWVKEGARGGCWFLLVHARNHTEEQSARDALKSVSKDVVATL